MQTPTCIEMDQHLTIPVMPINSSQNPTIEDDLKTSIDKWAYILLDSSDYNPLTIALVETDLKYKLSAQVNDVTYIVGPSEEGKRLKECQSLIQHRKNHPGGM